MDFEQRYTRGSSGEAIPNYGNPPVVSGRVERAWPCAVCKQPFRESRIRWFRGKPYGIPCSDYKDIYGILLQEQSARQNPPAGQRHEESAELRFG